ncbi:hypothetical protein ACWIG5_09650 [Streptomyces lydicus]
MPVDRHDFRAGLPADHLLAVPARHDRTASAPHDHQRLLDGGGVGPPVAPDGGLGGLHLLRPPQEPPALRILHRALGEVPGLVHEREGVLHRPHAREVRRQREQLIVAERCPVLRRLR